MSNLAITIGRQFGSGGREIGILLADKLGIKCFDKEIIKRASEENGISEKMFEQADEKPINSFLYSIVAHGFPTYTMPLHADNMFSNDKIFTMQAGTIKRISEEMPAVFIGRCANDILRKNEKLVSIFIYSNMEDKIKRISEKYNISEKESKEMIRRIDKSRSSYYEFYANQKWGDLNNYMLCINSSCGIDKTVNILYKYIMELGY
ncbi:MAG: cytidylate kinase-like family protein [Ruminococcaceae bacterium]|nr:cytidylate kinase-like family protein [Oscillospiraceae bacterium]